MSARFTAEQELVAETIRDLAADGRAHARLALDGADLPPEPTASLFGGFAGLAVPEERGGMGGNLVDLAIVLHELGRTVMPTPFVGHVLATQVALAAGIAVEDAAAGEVRWCLAVNEHREPSWGPWETKVTDAAVEGRKVGVAEGRDADAAVVVGAEGAVALAVPSGRTPATGVDRTRPVADLEFSGPPVEVGRPLGHEGLRRAGALLAAELAGVGRGVTELAVAFAKEREQFGQPIGKFQGVAHQLADAYNATASAWSLALFAAWAVDAEDPGAARAVHAALGKAAAAAVQAAEIGTQVHGGIGITWEADPHLYLRRALASSTWLGTAAWHRQMLAREVLAGH